MPVCSDAWFAYGLQHCFQWEFEFNLQSGNGHSNASDNDESTVKKNDYANSVSVSAAKIMIADVPHPYCRLPISLGTDLLRELDIALPMRLAMVAATALWQRKIDSTISSHDMQSHELCNKSAERNIVFSDDRNVICHNDKNDYRKDGTKFKTNSGNKKSKFSSETLENSLSFADELRTES